VRSVTLFLLPTLLLGSWTEFSSSSFQVLSEDRKEGRTILNYLEQHRHAVGTAVGVPGLKPLWPVRVIVSRARKGDHSRALVLGRDAYVGSLASIEPETAASLTRILLSSWTGQIPTALERGLISLYSTLDVDGTKVTLGVPPVQKDRDWSRAHMLMVDPSYSGKVRALLGNLGRGIDADVAYRNAFEKTPEQVDMDLDRYIERGQYGTYPVSGLPINAEKQFPPKPIDEKRVRLYQADLLLANQALPAARTAYMALNDLPEAQEGLGLLAIQSGQPSEAVELLAQARSAIPLVERSKIEKSPDQRRLTLNLASKANPRWAEPHRLLAEVETQPAQRLAALRMFAQLDPRNPDAWIALAQAQEANKQFKEAAKSWTAAERANTDPENRERIREARAASERMRVDQQVAERTEERRKQDEELNTLRNKALMDIRAAEARANRDRPVTDAQGLDYYREPSDAKSVKGVLTRVDCLGEQARLHVRAGKVLLRILVVDPNNVGISDLARAGAKGEKSLTCGTQTLRSPTAASGQLGKQLQSNFIEFHRPSTALDRSQCTRYFIGAELFRQDGSVSADANTSP
jgi:hypothetical protein